MAERSVYTFESGRRAKPDRIEAGLVHMIGAYLLELGEAGGRPSRFNVRAHGTHNGKPTWWISGEVSGFLLEQPGVPDSITRIAADHYAELHRTQVDIGDIVTHIHLKPQAEPLAMNRAAGDAGNPIAFAYGDGPFFLPWERYLAVGVRKLIDTIYHGDGVVPGAVAERSGLDRLNGLRADGKIVVSVRYEGSAFYAIDSINVAVEHEPGLSLDELRSTLGKIIPGYLSLVGSQHRVALKRRSTPIIVVNTNGAWNEGGLLVDDGVSEAKPHEDYFGARGCSEDAPWGEDPTKPSGTGSIAARYAAVQLVARGLAPYARVSLEYRIGEANVGVNVVTDDTGRLVQDRLESWVRDHVPLSIPDVTKTFGLCDPRLYRNIANEVDFFDNPHFPWNRLHPDGAV